MGILCFFFYLKKGKACRIVLHTGHELSKVKIYELSNYYLN